MNHRGGTRSNVAYQYFGNTFEATTERPFAAGEEIVISYGDMPNDPLLLYYGFVEIDNEHDQYEVSSLLKSFIACLLMFQSRSFMANFARWAGSWS